MPRLKTGRGLGYSALISGQYLVLETVTGKGQLTGKMSRTPSKVEKLLEPHKVSYYTVSKTAVQTGQITAVKQQ